MEQTGAISCSPREQNHSINADYMLTLKFLGNRLPGLLFSSLSRISW